MPQIARRLVDSRSGTRTRRSPILLCISALLAVLALSGCAGLEDNGTQMDTLETMEARRNVPPPPAGTPGEGGEGNELAARGQQLAQSLGCLGCHTTTGQPSVGPTWQGLYGSEVPTNQGVVVADDEYIIESIREPNAKIHEGFQPIMPAFPNLSDEDIQAIIAYIQTLS
jgi:mono/diheme cytochrome c family protein